MSTYTLRVAIGACVSLAAAGCFLADQATGEHPEWRRVVATPAQFDLRGERVGFTSRDSTPLRAWWVDAAPPARGTVILVHGQAANGSYMLGRAAFLVRAGWNACVIDLRDTGESGGSYITPGYKESEDVLAAVAYVKGRTRGGRIVLLGHSAGAVAVLRAAAAPEIDAAVAESPFASYRAMLRRAAVYVRHQPNTSVGTKIGLWLSEVPGMLPLSEWAFRRRTGVSISPDSADARFAVRQLGARPVLYVAGERDSIAPAAEVAELYRATPGARNQFVTIAGAAHNVFGGAPAAYERAVLAFLAGM